MHIGLIENSKSPEAVHIYQKKIVLTGNQAHTTASALLLAFVILRVSSVDALTPAVIRRLFVFLLQF